MKIYYLSQGIPIKVDDDIFDQIKDQKWRLYAGKYVARNTKRKGIQKLIYLHRMIINAKPEEYVDHINGDSLDNRRKNLRICTNAQNNWNKGKQSNNKSGYKGVYWDKFRNKWHVEIQANGKKKHLGRFENINDAVKVYRKAAKKMHGKFAKF